MEFKLDGKKIEALASDRISKIAEYLDKMPDGELTTINPLAQKFKYINVDTLRKRLKFSCPDNTVYSVGKVLYFGNKRTIKEYKKQANL